MKKIPTLFKREFENHDIKRILPEFNDGFGDWVFDLKPTVKIDGSCCMVKDGKFYIRYDAKKGKKAPDNAIPCCEPDPITGHHPHWLPCDENTVNGKWHWATFDSCRMCFEIEDGTYEAVGVHFQGNPYNLPNDTLIKHGEIILPEKYRLHSFDDCRRVLAELPIEGIVWWGDEPVCKLKRSDFGLEWPCAGAKMFV